MKKLFLLAVLLSSSAIASQLIPARSVPTSADLLKLKVGTRILVTEDLPIRADLATHKNLMVREALVLGRWCYVGTHEEGKSAVKVGSFYTVKSVSVEPGPGVESRYITVVSNEGLEVSCLGSFIDGISVGKVEEIFGHNIKFVSP